jgi:thiosulfate/3-mercaptopyruvate sulfurtransferase
LDDDALRIYDCRFSLVDKEKGYSAYLNGHIPGASYVHLENDLSGPVTPQTGRHPIPKVDLFIKRLGELGLEQQSRVVIYDEGPSAQAARFWWLLRWMGHETVSVLDGGFKAWQSDGGPVTQGNEAYDSRTYLAKIGSFESVDAEDVAGVLNAKTGFVIDARENKRFIGEEEPLDRIAGHIPGSINRPFQSNLESGMFKSSGQLREEFEELISGRAPHEVIHTCGSGVTACHNLLAMEYCGLLGSKLYLGSWSDWITDPTRPIAGKDQVE